MNDTTEAIKGFSPQIANCRITLSGSSIVSDGDVLGRCGGNFLNLSQEMPTLNDICIWVCSMWRSSHRNNVYDMNDSEFLLELPSRKEAERVIDGDWRWNKSKLSPEWWMLAGRGGKKLDMDPFYALL